MTMSEHGLAQGPAVEPPYSPPLTVGQLPGFQRGEAPSPNGATNAASALREPAVLRESPALREPVRAQLPGDTMVDPVRPPLADLDLDSYPESSFGSGSWLDGPMESLVDHPILRGLLLELPPKGSQPSAEWLNRWFEAARAVLDLIYLRR
jgi:hypothetical protein